MMNIKHYKILISDRISHLFPALGDIFIPTFSPVSIPGQRSLSPFSPSSNSFYSTLVSHEDTNFDNSFLNILAIRQRSHAGAFISAKYRVNCWVRTSKTHNRYEERTKISHQCQYGERVLYSTKYPRNDNSKVTICKATLHLIFIGNISFRRSICIMESEECRMWIEIAYAILINHVLGSLR